MGLITCVKVKCIYSERIKSGKGETEVCICEVVDRGKLNCKAPTDSSAWRRQYPFPYVMEQVHSWLVHKDTRPWNKTVYPFDLIDIYRTRHPTREYMFFSSVMEHLPRLTIFWARNKFYRLEGFECILLPLSTLRSVIHYKDLQHSEKLHYSPVSVDHNKRLQIIICKGAYGVPSGTDLNYSVFSISRGQTDTVWRKAFTHKSHCKYNYRVWPKAPDTQRDFLWGGMVQGLTGYSPRTAQGPVLSWEHAKLENPKPASPFSAQTIMELV